MRIRPRVAVLAAAPVLAAGVLGGTAFAATHASPPASTTGTQTAVPAQGSQTGTTARQAADTPEPGDSVDPAKAATTAAAGTASGAETATAGTRDQLEQPGNESDGPGGHADANGVDVNHEFNGNE